MASEERGGAALQAEGPQYRAEPHGRCCCTETQGQLADAGRPQEGFWALSGSRAPQWEVPQEGVSEVSQEL